MSHALIALICLSYIFISALTFDVVVVKRQEEARTP